jgi:DNA-directed RNA polymerase subunit RPC12/RpoP
MSSVALKVIRPPGSVGEHRAPEIVRPLFRGSGDVDYVCGNCGSVIASNMGPAQRVNVDAATCSACGAENEFPPNLRP